MGDLQAKAAREQMVARLETLASQKTLEVPPPQRLAQFKKISDWSKI